MGDLTCFLVEEFHLIIRDLARYDGYVSSPVRELFKLAEVAYLSLRRDSSSGDPLETLQLLCTYPSDQGECA
jgi:hypothetical protein